MAIDLEAIRKRVQELSGQRKVSSVQLWKPNAGEYKVRGIPWKPNQIVEGMPFIERRFYYLGDNPRILAPQQGKPDPINDLIRKLYSTKSPEDREMAKKLQPKMTAYMAIIVRGEEEKGVQVWGFNKFIYQRLLGFFTTEDIGDFLDPNDGFDLDVKITPSPKRFNNKPVFDTTIDAARRSSKLHADPATAKKWLDSVPNVDDMFQQKTEKEIEQMLNAWLTGSPPEPAGHSDGTAKGGLGGKDELDRLVEDVRGDADGKQPAARKQKKDDAAGAAAKTTLDDAFDELMEEGDGD